MAVWIAIIWTVVIILACLLPVSELPVVPLTSIDKWTHLIIFAVFSFLWLATCLSPNYKKKLFIIICSVLLGLCIELLQSSAITSGRSYENLDVVADAIGGILGVIIYTWLHHYTHANMLYTE